MAEHTRIDEGIKRGPRKRKNGALKAPNERPERGRMTPGLHPQTVLERYLDDEKIEEIARSCGVSGSRLHHWLLEKSPDEWRKAQVVRAITALEKSKAELNSAKDPMELAKAREILRGAQWELERLFSRFFGQKQELAVSMDHNITVSQELQEECSALIQRFRNAAPRESR